MHPRDFIEHHVRQILIEGGALKRCRAVGLPRGDGLLRQDHHLPEGKSVRCLSGCCQTDGQAGAKKAAAPAGEGSDTEQGGCPWVM